ncbi:hypothetical protein N2152v2_004759 [Parachlorella kessleri]
MTQKQNVLRAYRELLTLIKRLPSDQKQKSWQEARSLVRQHAREPDPVKQSDMLKEMVAKISYLRVVTPRVPGEKSATGSGHWVMRNGELVEGEGLVAGERVADGKLSMSEARDRHQQLLKRQFFGREPPRYNPSNF